MHVSKAEKGILGVYLFVQAIFISHRIATSSPSWIVTFFPSLLLGGIILLGIFCIGLLNLLHCGNFSKIRPQQVYVINYPSPV